MARRPGAVAVLLASVCFCRHEILTPDCRRNVTLATPTASTGAITLTGQRADSSMAGGCNHSRTPSASRRKRLLLVGYHFIILALPEAKFRSETPFRYSGLLWAIGASVLRRARRRSRSWDHRYVGQSVGLSRNVEAQTQPRARSR